MKFVFDCRNYRGLLHANFEPEGVCVLVGANGSGKSTLLNAFAFVRNLYSRMTRSAITLDGGLWGLRNFSAGATCPIDFRIDLGGTWNHNWVVQLRTAGAEQGITMHEYLLSSDRSNHLLDSFAMIASVAGSKFKLRDVEFPRGDGSALKLAWESTQDEELSPLVRFVDSIRTYRHYNLSQLREHGSRADSEHRLSYHGENLFTVLRNWRDRRDSQSSFDFVTESLSDAFPDFFEMLEFYGDAQTIRAKVFLEGVSEPMPVSFIPDGLLTAMIHLVAVAGAPEHSFLAIDDFENYLHPFAIQSLIGSIRSLAAQRDLCVLMATHSPVVLDEFRTEPNRVFVMELDPPQKPTSLDKLRDTEWLSHFSFGDLYSRFDFGARLPSTTK